MSPLLPSLLRLLFAGCALMAGTYFAFSAFVMPALAQLDPSSAMGARAMQEINRVILRSPFMPVFFGSSLLSLVAIAAAAFEEASPAGPPMLFGALVYLGGMFAVTAFGNVPLNDALEAARGPELEGVWQDYLRDWTRLNHLRSAASLLAAMAFAEALRRVVG